ncbi:MAG: Rieske 2Fe-2S domain-containing protein [Pigmentiphaga sp.]|uniref:Rieske 2Fe-2S domain-containing protein n=1 Tax=Pigmentiphaga sp. TaxID=1977564 RepID=UPI0029B91BAB|nr:Rieske 2Fe-2S domain-containing protein [Pigmentiphaga sp.]MDX3905771.1 Rieske 2Fe-2S domain-containing protein [Pigmentiphaga sp.]
MSDKQDWPELVRGVPQGLELGLRNYWYPIIQSEELPADKPLGLKCLNEDLVVFRDGQGRPNVLYDRCPHRFVKLSSGRVLDGQLQCAYHGLRFDGQGACVLIPWEPEAGQEQLSKVCAKHYPCTEIGGYVWAYLGEVERFPPPPIETCIPEELLYPDRFVHFRLDTEEWDANWLLVIDGSDAYHAVTLHMESQFHEAVERYLAAGGDAAHAKPLTPLADRRVKIVETDGHGLRGVSVDLEGNMLDHGHRLDKIKGERFNLPGLVSNLLRPTSNAAPYVSRLFQVPIDYHRTRLFRYAAWRIEGPDDRERLKEHFEKVVKPRQMKTAEEDKEMARVAGDLVESRANEVLFAPDRDMIRIRRRLAAAYVAQQTQNVRAPADEPTPTPASLVFPA